jgi:hypothetical protein
MAVWILGILLAAIVVAAIIALSTGGAGARARKERRERYKLEETDGRIDLASPRSPAPPPPAPVEIAPVSRPHDSQLRPDLPPDLAPLPAVAETQDARPPAAPIGRMVMTPDGEMILTTPPFELREAIFTKRAGRYVASLYRRLPPWVVICPKVRLDSLLIPTRPDGRDAEDWRTWRQRVRTRTVDFVLCDRRTWKPLLAVIVEGAPGSSTEQGPAPESMKLGGGKDRIIDEVLGAVGLPLIRGTGRFIDDWGMIRPYIENAILPAPSEDQLADEARRARPSSAVSLLRMDDTKGWLLE